MFHISVDGAWTYLKLRMAFISDAFSSSRVTSLPSFDSQSLLALWYFFFSPSWTKRKQYPAEVTSQITGKDRWGRNYFSFVLSNFQNLKPYILYYIYFLKKIIKIYHMFSWRDLKALKDLYCKPRESLWVSILVVSYQEIIGLLIFCFYKK